MQLLILRDQVPTYVLLSGSVSRLSFLYRAYSGNPVESMLGG
jgi:hypothetical protein